ncbi:MAG TPA: hypothetical protein VHP33_27510 [Polyangiaceae bacterium]|nr:hypothetical protein [Polyangiaceae bacterium]
MRFGFLLGAVLALAACKERSPEMRAAPSGVASVVVAPNAVAAIAPAPGASAPALHVAPRVARFERLARSIEAKPGCAGYGIVLSVAWPSQSCRTTWLTESLRAAPELLTWLGEGGGVK